VQAQQTAVGGSGSRDAGAYRRARRHSIVVRFLRRVIPLGAAVAIAAVVAVAVLDPFGRGAGLSLGPISLSGTKVTMEAPRLTGFRQGNRGYEVTASAAMQDVRKPTLIELVDLRGRMVTDDSGAAVRLKADFGVFDTQKEQLEVRDNVELATDDGQKAFLEAAFADFKAGTVTSRKPVKVLLKGAVIEADGLDVTENGKVISFLGNVRTLIERGAAPDPALGPTAARNEPVSSRP
jgi:lipopolysaccharide export system protein LptC